MSYAFFDLDNTLIDTEAALASWTRDFVREYDLTLEPEEIVALIGEVPRLRDFVDAAPEMLGIPLTPAMLLDWTLATYPAQVILYPGTLEGLAELRMSGWRLGVVTNGTTQVQRAKMDQVGLTPYFDVIEDSESSGSSKPDRAIFEKAARELDVELGPEGWMVGDLLDKDVAGAIAAGLRTIWISHGRPLPEGGPQPDHLAASIAEAIALLTE